MIAQPGWFGRRKYTGWGFTPKTWQGWAYSIVLVLPLPVMAALHVSSRTQLVVVCVWAVVLVAAMVDIKRSIVMDERETIHEAIAERNALWAILAVLAAGVAFEAARGIATNGVVAVDPVILVALAAGLLAKAATNIYLDRKN